MSTSKAVETLSDQELIKRIAELFGKGPLYRKLRFKNESLNSYPEIVRTYCPICQGERNFDQFSWEGMKSRRTVQGPFGPEQVETARRALRTLSYRCPDCKKHWVSYLAYWHEDVNKQEGFILKCGQYPELETILAENLEKSLPADDVALLRKAIRARDFNFGLAAVAYLRRVIENQIEPLIDRLLQERKANIEKLRAKVKKAKADRGFRKLLDIAGGVLPDYLKPHGQNPFVHLYRIESEGIHHLSEEECLEIFDESFAVLAFVFSELHRHNREVKDFDTNLRKISNA